MPKRNKTTDVLKSKVKKPLTSTQISKLKEKYLDIYSDPLDTSTDNEIAERLDVNINYILKWRNDPEVVTVGWSRFQPAFQNIKVPLMKDLIRQAIKGKSQKANEKLLEVLGVLSSNKNGTQVNVFNMGSNSSSIVAQALEKLTDEELSSEILRLQSSIQVEDVAFHKGKVVPVKDVLDVEYEELKVDSDLDRPTEV